MITDEEYHNAQQRYITASFVIIGEGVYQGLSSWTVERAHFDFRAANEVITQYHRERLTNESVGESEP